MYTQTHRYKWIAILLTICICMTWILPCFSSFLQNITISAYGADDTYTIGDITISYTYLDDDTIEITDCDTSASGELELPASIDDVAVTSIGEDAFENCAKLTTISIPKSITDIHYSAFSGCSGLTAITVDTENTSYCSIDGVLCNADISWLICYPAQKEDVAYDVPDTVTTILGYAFENCENLEEIQIPSSVTTITVGAFRGCSNLSAITVNSKNTSYTSVNGVLFNYAMTTLVCYPAGKTDTTYSIPTSVTSIALYAFYACTSLTSVSIPSGVTSIGNYAFYMCTKLSALELPESLTTIGDAAFANCISLMSVTFGDNLQYVYSYAFYNCNQLMFVTLPESVTLIDEKAFAECSSLLAISLGSNVTKIQAYALENCSALTDVYYASTEDDWDAISFGTDLESELSDVTIHFSSTLEIYFIQEDTSYTYTYTEGKQIYYVFMPNVSGTYSFSSSGSVNATGFYYGTSWKNSAIIQASSDEESGNFSLSTTLDAETIYYFGAESSADTTNTFTISIVLDEITLPDSITWTLGDDETYYYPNDELNGTSIQVPISVASAINTYGIQGALEITDATAELFMAYADETGTEEGYCLQYGTEAIQADSTVYPDLTIYTDVTSWMNGESSYIYFASDTTTGEVFKAQSASGTMLNLYLCLPDESTIVEIAAKYNLDLQLNDDGEYYYAFPLNWAIQDTLDIEANSAAISLISSNRFAYYYSEAQDDAFDEEIVTLTSGYINIIVDYDVAREAETPDTITWTLGDSDTYFYPNDSLSGERIEYPIYISNAIDAYGLTAALELTGATEDLLNAYATEFYEQYGMLCGYCLQSNTNVFKSSGEIYKKWTCLSNVESWMTDASSYIYFTAGVTSDTAAQAQADEGIMLYMKISLPDEDTVIEAAVENGLELQTNEDGDSYFAFPMTWASQGTPDIEDTGLSAAGTTVSETENLFSYLSSYNKDIFDSHVVLVDGTLNIIVDTETAEAAIEEANTIEMPDEIIWKLGDDDTYYYPNDALDGTSIDYPIYISGAIDTYGFTGALDLDTSTAKLLTAYDEYSLQLGDATIYANNAMYNDLSVSTDVDDWLTGNSQYLSFSASSSTDTYVTVQETDGIMLYMTLCLPDEETVVRIALNHDLKLQVNDNGEYYYAFPLTWAEQGLSDLMSTDTDTTEETYLFEYFNRGMQDIFDDLVTLEDGVINIVVDPEIVEFYQNSTWTLDQCTASPGETIQYAISIANAIPSMAIAGTLDLPAETVALLESSQVEATSTDLYDFNLERLSLDDTSFLFSFANYLHSTGTAVDATDSEGVLVYLTLTLPGEETILEIADTYGLSVQQSYGGLSYIEFPVLWADPEATTSFYTYMDADAEDHFPDYVTLSEDGYIRIYLSNASINQIQAENVSVSTTTATTDTTTSTTTQTATTETETTAEQTTTTEDTTTQLITAATADTTTTTTTAATGTYDFEFIEPNAEELVVGNTVQLEYITTYTGTLSWSSSDTSVASVDDSGQITIYAAGTVTITVTLTDNEAQSFTVTLETTEASYMLGDVDNDGEITQTDAYLTLQHHTIEAGGGEGTLTALQLLAADIDADGTITISDAYKILKYYAITAGGDEASWDAL